MDVPQRRSQNLVAQALCPQGTSAHGAQPMQS